MLAVDPIIQLLQFLLLTSYPSGSAIAFYNDKLYLVGDDAVQVLVLTKSYETCDSIKLTNITDRRIPKATKPDFESSVVIEINGKHSLLIMGSAATEARKKITIIPFNTGLSDNDPIDEYRLDLFIDRMMKKGIGAVNIEGLTQVGKKFVLANRGNIATRKNQLVVTNNNFWLKQKTSTLDIQDIMLPGSLTSFIGISDMHYVADNDVLFITFSSEETTNAYDDGQIGNSYIGWIANASKKIGEPTLTIDKLVDLSQIDAEFKNQKIEGICVESSENSGHILNLISDNDNGQSKLFKLKFQLKPSN